MFGSESAYATQALTFAIPIGSLVIICVWGFFQRRPSR